MLNICGKGYPWSHFWHFLNISVTPSVIFMGAPAKILSLQLPLVPLVSLCWPHSQEKYEGWQALFAAVTRDRGRLQWLYCPDCSHHLQTNIRARLVSAVSSVAALVFIVHLENESAFSTRGEEEGGRQHTVHIQISFLLVLDNFDIVIVFAIFRDSERASFWQTRSA